MSSVLAPRRRTHQEALAEETFNRATKSAVVTAQIRADRERDEFEALTGLKVDRVTGFILRETKAKELAR